MPSIFERDEALLLLMLEIVEKIENFNSSIQSLEEFEKDAKVHDASMMNFIVIGELVIKLSSDFLEKHNDIEWYKIKSFRNYEAHDYFGISPKIVWDIIQNKLPELKIKLKQITGR